MAPRRDQAPAEVAPPSSGGPVILLTGFEPFGGRTANASWEGIAALDGRTWHGYKLGLQKDARGLGHAARATASIGFPSIIRSPSSLSGRSIRAAERKSKALNRREAKDLDNRHAPPPSTTILADGPAEYAAGAPCDKLVQALSKPDRPVRLSTSAGRYLCNETLYSLERLKTHDPGLSVLFCHVPPLGSTLSGKPVTAATVQAFVEDVLDAWLQLEPAGTAPSPLESPAERAAVEKFIRHYFSSWSDHDMQAYGDCFADNACIQFVSPAGQLITVPKKPFVAGQERASASRRIGRASAESIDIRFEWKLAHALAYWKLTAGPRTEYGYDHFTLMKFGGQWRIIHLVFYVTKSSG